MVSFGFQTWAMLRALSPVALSASKGRTRKRRFAMGRMDLSANDANVLVDLCARAGLAAVLKALVGDRCAFESHGVNPPDTKWDAADRARLPRS